MASDESVRVLVLDSADEDFWVAHADVENLIAMANADRDLASDIDIVEILTGFHGLVDAFRTLPIPTIAVVAGRARGGGCELAMSFDLRYGVAGKTVFGQPEVALGIIPGGSGTQRWPRLTNRSRAIEMIVGGLDIDAETAERWGALTRALPEAELVPFVERLTARIASSPPEAVRAAKRSVDAAGDNTAAGIAAGLHAEATEFAITMATDAAVERMSAFLADGGQQRSNELEIAPLLDGLGIADD